MTCLRLCRSVHTDQDSLTIEFLGSWYRSLSRIYQCELTMRSEVNTVSYWLVPRGLNTDKGYNSKFAGNSTTVRKKFTCWVLWERMLRCVPPRPAWVNTSPFARLYRQWGCPGKGKNAASHNCIRLQKYAVYLSACKNKRCIHLLECLQ